MNEYIYYENLISNSSYGKDEILLNKDINLLENTNHDDRGFFIIDIDDELQTKIQKFLLEQIYLITNKRINIEKYHEMISDEEHTKIINNMPYKKNNDAINKIAIYLEDKISSSLKCKVKIFNDDLWIRICRPSSFYKSDFNPFHRDIYLDFYRNTINIYLPISGSDEKSSLTMQPSSHKWNENITRTTKGGSNIRGKKYSVDAIVCSKIKLNMIRPNPLSNQLLIFSPYLIHGGAHNDNMQTRFSLEVRFIKDNPESHIQELSFIEFLNNRNWR
jgi:hypothetical protein